MMDKFNLIIVLIFLNFFMDIKSEDLYKTVRPAENYVQQPYKNTFYKVAPKDMQLRRFMWNGMDETMDDIYQGVSTGAQVMRQALVDAFAPITRVKKQADEMLEPQASESTSIRYIIRSPHRVMRIIKMPRNVIKIYTKPPPPHPLPQTAALTMGSNSKNLPPVVHKFEVSNLRNIERQEEKRVEEAMAELYSEGKINDTQPILTKGYTEDNIITDNIDELDDSWKPITKKEAANSEKGAQPPKSYPVSSLNTDIFKGNAAQNEPAALKHTYEVTEKVEETEESSNQATFNPIFSSKNLKNSFEKTSKTQTKKPSKEIRTTTEKPNYPENFLINSFPKTKYSNEFNTESAIASVKLKKTNSKYTKTSPKNSQSLTTTLLPNTVEVPKPTFKYSSKFKKISSWKPKVDEDVNNSDLKTSLQDEFEQNSSELNPVSVGYRTTPSTTKTFIPKSWKRSEVTKRGNKKFNIEIESLD